MKKVTNSKDQSFEFEYDAEGDRFHYKKNVKDNFDDETWYKSLEETEFTDVKDLLEDKNSKQTFDALRYQAQYHIDNKTCVLMPEYDDSDWYAKDINYVLY